MVGDAALWITDGNEFGPTHSVLPAAAWAIVGGLAVAGAGAGNAGVTVAL